jgi:hypothetical protein
VSARAGVGEQAAVGGVLLSALGGPKPPRPARVDPRRLARMAEWHGVEGYVLQYLLDAGFQPGELRELDAACRARALTHLRKVADLRTVQQALDAAGVPCLVVKGPVVSESLHGSATLRGYDDVDVLVAPADLRGAVHALEAAGAEMIDRNWARLIRERRGQCHLHAPRGTLVDLHWHLVNEARLRASLGLRTEELFARSRTVAVGPLRIPTTDPVDTLLHLCLHTTTSAGDRLIWFKDIERAVAAVSDWSEVVERAPRWGGRLLVGSALDAAVRLLDAPVPPEALRALAPPRLWRWANLVGERLTPPEQLEGEGAVYRMVGRSTRGDLRSSMAELTRRGARHLRPGPRDGTGGDLFDEAVPDSLHLPAGSREEFFAMVAAEADPPAGP